MAIEIDGETYGLTDEGLTIPPEEVFEQFLRDDYEEQTGLEVDWERDEVLSTLFGLYAEGLYKVALMMEEIYDAGDPENASGFRLDALADITGIRRHVARPARIELELRGDRSVTVPKGKVVEDDQHNRWELIEDVELEATSDSTVYVGTGVAEAKETGDISFQFIDEIVTPVAGWEEVSVNALLQSGRDRETDHALRTRRAESLQVSGGSSKAAIRARLLEQDAVLSAEVYDNPTNYEKDVAKLEDAPPHSVVVYIFGDAEENDVTGTRAGSIESEDDRKDVANVLFDSVAAGVQFPAAEDADDYATVITADGVETDVTWFYPDIIPVDVEVNVGGVDSDDVKEDVEELVDEYFKKLFVGENVQRLPLLAAIAGIDGVDTAMVKFAEAYIAPPADADFAVDRWELATLSQVSISEI